MRKILVPAQIGHFSQIIHVIYVLVLARLYFLFQMSSINDSFSLLVEEHPHPHSHIFKALSEYEERCDSDEELTVSPDQTEATFQGFENKKSLKIKPVHMFKDLISLQKENTEKKRQVKELQQINAQLRREYQMCLTHNDKLEHFFKEVEFTFQSDNKKISNSEVMLRTKQTLFQQAKQAKEKMKKMYKSSDASAIQQLKAYISIIEAHRQDLAQKVDSLRKIVTQRIQQEDLNPLQVSKLNRGCQQIRKILNSEKDKAKARHEQYKVEKMLMKGKVKARHLDAQKRKYKEQCENMKSLLRESEGLEYEIQLLKHRVKDKKKENIEYQQLLEKIKQKESVTLRLEKELREKYKTYEYMLQWSKELKKQLEARKSQHAKKKAAFEDQINFLTTEFEKYSQLYKAGLFQEQAAKRKGSRQLVTNTEVSKPTKVKLVAFEEIRTSMRSLSFFLLDTQQEIDQFIDELLRVRPNRPAFTEKEGRKLKVKSTLSIGRSKAANKDCVTMQDICDSFDFSKSHNLTKAEYTKLAQFIVQDGQGSNQAKEIEIKIARQIMKNLLRREIESEGELIEIEQNLSEFLRRHGDAMRPELKLSGGWQQQFDVNVLKQAMKKHGLDPYHYNLYSQYMQFWGWRKDNTVGCLKLSTYDEVLSSVTKNRPKALQQVAEE